MVHVHLSNTVESTYMSSAYKSFSVISRVTLWTEFVPSLYVLKKGRISRLCRLKISVTSRDKGSLSVYSLLRKGAIGFN